MKTDIQSTAASAPATPKHANDRKADASQTGGKPDTANKSAQAAETLAKRGDGVDPVVKLETSTLGGASLRPGASNIFVQHTEEKRKDHEARQTLLQRARQSLAQAVDFEKEGATKANEAKAASEMGGHWLYQARRLNVISSDELNGILGDLWGYKNKPDGTPSKTPNGGGETLRKRIVRAVAMNDFVTTGESDNRLFDGLTPEDVQPIVEEMNREEEPLSIFSAYDKVGKLKSDRTTRVDNAFNPKLLSGLVEKLASPGSANVIARSPALVAAYAALIDTLNIVGAQAAAIAAENKAKAAEPLPQGAVA